MTATAAALSACPCRGLCKIVRVEANQPFIDVLVADLQLGGMFEDTDFAENLQAAHDGWCNAVREGDADEEWHKAQFLRLIGHPAAAVA